MISMNQMDQQAALITKARECMQHVRTTFLARIRYHRTTRDSIYYDLRSRIRNKKEDNM